MRKFLCIVLTVMLFAFSVTANGNETSFSEAKKEFASKHSENYIDGYNEKRNGIIRNKSIDKILAECYLNDELSAAEALLKEFKVYKMDTDSFIEPLPYDNRKNWPVYLFTPDIYYDSVTNQWLVVSGGYWIEDEFWQIDSRVQIGGSSEKYVGGYDCIGFKNYEAAENEAYFTYDVCVMISDGSDSIELTSLNNVDYRLGDFFCFRDYISANGYMGKYFSVVVRSFDSFAETDIIPAMYYAHTCPGGELVEIDDSAKDIYHTTNGFIIDTYNGVLESDDNIHFGGSKRSLLIMETSASGSVIQLDNSLYVVFLVLCGGIVLTALILIVVKGKKKKE